MMKFRGLAELIAVGSLMIASIISGLIAILIFLSSIFGFSPYFSDRDGGGLGLSGYENGTIPVNVIINATIPDTTIRLVTKKGVNFITTNRHFEYRPSIINDSILWGDTINTEYDGSGDFANHVKGASLNEGKIFIYPVDFGDRIALNAPALLKLSLLSYCCWQIGMLLSIIAAGKAFPSRNYYRLRNAGIAIIVVCLFLYLFDLLSNRFNFFNIHFESTIEHFRQPFPTGLQMKSSLEITWLVVGCIFIILSFAFKKGTELQQEQDLTV